MLKIVIWTVITVTALGLVLAVVLYLVARRFKVEEDPRIDEVEKVMPGANCGGCGFAGCRAFAEATVKAASPDENFCPVGGNDVMAKVAAILGFEAKVKAPMVAVVRCNGTCENRPRINEYGGYPSCKVKAALYSGDTGCAFGCLGCGDCVAACQFGALSMDPVTGKVQYRTDSLWQDVDFEAVEQQNAESGTLKLRYTPTPALDDPKYYNHFSISRILDDGTTQLLNYDEGDSGLEDGSSWSNTFKNGTSLDAGTYMLTSGTRAASGKVLVANRIFTVKPGETTTINLTMRQSDDIVAVIGNFDSESKFQLLDNELKPVNADPVSILSQTGRGYFIVGVLGVGQEPTNHAMRDIAKMSAELDKWGRPMVLLFEDETEAQKYRHENYGILPQNIIYGIDRDGSIRRQIAQQMKLQNETQLPIFILADTFNRVLFCSQGYTIGLGEQFTKVINNLDK